MAGNCIGIVGHDTKATSDSKSSVRIKIDFANLIGQDSFRVRLFANSFQDLSATLTGPSGVAYTFSPSEDRVVINAQYQDVFYVDATVRHSVSNEGGCCQDNLSTSTTVSVLVEKEPILEAKAGLEPQIRGGEPVPPDQFTEVVGLMIDGKIHCTATAIADRALLTAAHCLNGYENMIAQGRMTFSRASVVPDRSGATVGKIVGQRYPKQDADGFGYDPGTFIHDIGLVYTDDPLQTTFPELHSGHPSWTSLVPNQFVSFVGYGLDVASDGSMMLAGVKREATWRFSRQDDTRAYYDPTPQKQGTCRGDSGGPAYLLQDGKKVLLAVTSEGDKVGCTFGLDTKIDAHLGWIIAHLKQEARP